MKVKLPANVLAAQLLSVSPRFTDFADVQRQMAVEMLTIHIEASRKLGTPASLKAAATDAIFMASIYERAYEPIPASYSTASSSLNNSHLSAWAEDL